MDNTNRDKEIKELREQGWTLRRIGKKFGLTRERVRQIAGNTGHLASRIRRQQIKNESPRRTNIELAQKYKVKPTRIGQVRDGWYRTGGDSTMAVARAWQERVARILEDRGHKVEMKRAREEGYNILLNGQLRISVRSSGPMNPPSSAGKNPRYAFDVPQSGVDFILLAMSDTADIFVVPRSAVPPGARQIVFHWPTERPTMSRYQKYHQRFDLLGDQQGYSEEQINAAKHNDTIAFLKGGKDNDGVDEDRIVRDVGGQ